jgi:transmembrane sensor
MKLDELLPLAEKLAYQTYSKDELSSVMNFLKHADRADAEAFMDEYARIVSALPADLEAEAETSVNIKELRFHTSSQGRDPIPSGRLTRRTIVRRSLRYAAAVLCLVGASYLLIRTIGNEPVKTEQISRTEEPRNEIPPAESKATLTLSNGEVVLLDNNSDGQVAVQPGTRILKKDGSVIYSSDKSDHTSTAFNTMSTPNGGQYALTLSDGTRIWLNAASSITYPTVFDGTERAVSIVGEVYFEVAHRQHQPFIVEAAGDRVIVLGTVFNIRAYPESSVKTSLVQGSVSINDKVLEPGQAYQAGKIVQTSVEQDLAWRNGYFNFHGMNLRMVMREIARWYDVNVVFPQGIPKIEFGGELQRNLDLSQILKALEKSKVRFQIQSESEDGRKTIVVLN